MEYLSYNEYRLYGGTIPETLFLLLEIEAKAAINKYTFGRLKNLDEQTKEVKVCMFKLINIIKSYNSLEEQDKNISSENIDGYSVSYKNGNNGSQKAKNNEIKEVIYNMLSECKLEDGTPYLYRGK